MQRLLGTVHATTRFERQGALEGIRAELESWVQTNDEAAKKRSKLGWRAFYAFVFLVFGAPILFVGASFVFGVVGGVLEEQYPDLELVGPLLLVGMAIGALLALIPIILFVVLLIKRSRITKLDLDPVKVAVASQALRVLASDAKPSLPAHVVVDFAAYDQGAAVPTRTGAKAYRHPWLSISAVLTDGTRVRLLATVKGKKKVRVKRKYTKRKEQWVDVIELRLGDKRAPVLPADASQRVTQRLGYSFPRVAKHRSGQRQVMLRFETAVCQRITGRGASIVGQEQRLDPSKLVSAVVRGYRAFIALRRELAKPAVTAKGTQMMPQVVG